MPRLYLATTVIPLFLFSQHMATGKGILEVCYLIVAARDNAKWSIVSLQVIMYNQKYEVIFLIQTTQVSNTIVQIRISRKEGWLEVKFVCKISKKRETKI